MNIGRAPGIVYQPAPASESQLIRWQEALYSLQLNPLVKYWGRRTVQRLSRTTALLLYTLLVVALNGICIFVLRAMLEWGYFGLGQDPGVAFRYVIMPLTILPTLLLLYPRVRDALALFGDVNASKLRFGYDDMIACSAISPEDFIAGSVYVLVRPLAPLLIANAAVISLYLLAFANDLSVFLLQPLEFVLRSLSSILAAAVFMLLLLAISGGRFASSLPYIGAPLAVMLQLLLSGAYLLQDAANDVFLLYGDYTFGPPSLVLPVLNSLFCLILLLPLIAGGMYLARQVHAFRYTLAGLFPLGLASAMLVLNEVYYWSHFGDIFRNGHSIARGVAELHWALSAFALLNPQGALAASSDYILDSYAGWRLWLLLGFQVLLLWLAAGWAREALLRRRVGLN